MVQSYLRRVYGRLGGTQFMKSDGPEIPEWLFAEAHRQDVQSNWIENKMDIPLNEVPYDANVIGSHIVYKIKMDKNTDTPTSHRILVLKARICVHGNHDDERESLRTDAAVASHFAFRLVYSLAMIFGLVLAKVDIRGAYTQSGPAKRRVYVRPPHILQIWNVFWLLTMAIYSIVSAGRKWQRASDEVMIQNLGLSMVLGLPQLFHHQVNRVSLVIAKYVDDLLLAGRSAQWIEWATGGIRKSFDISSATSAPSVLSVNSTEVHPQRWGTTLDMRRYSRSEIELLCISSARRKKIADELSYAEEKEVIALAGKLNYLGTGASPFAAFSASYIQQFIPRMTVAGLKEVNSVVREVIRRDPCILYLKPSVAEKGIARIVAFSDAGFPHRGEQKKVAQEGCVVGIAFGKKKGSIFHCVGFISRKQRRTSQSTPAAEIIAAVMTLGYAQQLQHAYREIVGVSLPLTLVIDSKGLHESLATEHSSRDPSVAADVQLLREGYASKAIDKLVWIPGKMNPANALTKPHAGSTSEILQDTLRQGRLQVSVDNKRGYGPALQEEL